MKILLLLLLSGLSTAVAVDKPGKIIEVKKQTTDIGSCSSNSYLFIRVKIDTGTVQLRIGANEAEAKEIISLALTALSTGMDVNVTYDENSATVCGSYKLQQLIIRAE